MARLRERGFAVTQATVSRDIADLGLVKAPRGDRHVYVTPGALAGGAGPAGAATAGGSPAGDAGGGPGSAGTRASSGPRDPLPDATGGGTRRALGAAEPWDAVGSAPAGAGTARLRRILADYPVRIARSGLSLVLISTAGTAAVIAQAIDESDLNDQVGTLAGDNTLLVLFADEPALERWRARFGAILQRATAGLDGDDLAGTYP